MHLKKLAIVKEGKDIGRIIPFNIDASGDYDFKIGFIKNDYEVNMYPFLSKAPEKFELEDMPNWELSYHRAFGLKPTVIHLKNKKDQSKYEPLPIKRLVDTTIYNAFPIPFMRLEIPPSSVTENYKPKPKEHIAFDMGDANVAEFYLAHIDFNYLEFMEKWPALSLKLMALSFEFFATNNLLTDEHKYKNFLPSDRGERRAVEEFAVNNDMKFYVNLYNNPELTERKIKVTFIENAFAEALLSLSPVGYENDKGKVEMFPAYKEDLRRDTMSSKEKWKWEYRFNKMQEKLEREIKKVKRNRR